MTAARWKPEELAYALELFPTQSCGKIAEQLNLRFGTKRTRNSVIGKMERHQECGGEFPEKIRGPQSRITFFGYHRCRWCKWRFKRLSRDQLYCDAECAHNAHQQAQARAREDSGTGMIIPLKNDVTDLAKRPGLPRGHLMRHPPCRFEDVVPMKWLICIFRGHIWTAKGPLKGAYCARCGLWEYER